MSLLGSVSKQPGSYHNWLTINRIVTFLSCTFTYNIMLHYSNHKLLSTSDIASCSLRCNLAHIFGISTFQCISSYFFIVSSDCFRYGATYDSDVFETRISHNESDWYPFGHMKHLEKCDTSCTDKLGHILSQLYRDWFSYNAFQSGFSFGMPPVFNHVPWLAILTLKKQTSMHVLIVFVLFF